MAKTKIDWCDFTWNPIWGCPNGCPYCYARGIARRFGKKVGLREARWHFENKEDISYLNGISSTRITDFVEPLVLWHRMECDFPRKPSRIFVNSMSDVAKWPAGAMGHVMERISLNNQHQYLFLTKSPRFYAEDFLQYFNGVRAARNVWAGVTITGAEHPSAFSNTVNTANQLAAARVPMFLSIEPLLKFDPFNFMSFFKVLTMTGGLKWVIIGAENGNRIGKVIPKKEWILEIARWCGVVGIPVFMKSSLKGIVKLDQSSPPF
jgi:protein gp37